MKKRITKLDFGYYGLFNSQSEMKACCNIDEELFESTKIICLNLISSQTVDDTLILIEEMKKLNNNLIPNIKNSTIIIVPQKALEIIIEEHLLTYHLPN